MKTYYYTSQTTHYEPYLAHHGVKGMKWGVRRYQNEDGSLTSAGEKRYGTVENLKKQRRAQKILGITIAAAVGGTLACVIGQRMWERNAYRDDEIVKMGDIIQNIAPKGRDFVSQFYGTTDKKDRQYFLKYFSSTLSRTHVSTVRADRDLRIAGMDAANNALREVLGVSKENYTNKPGTMARAFFDNYGDAGYAVETKKNFVDNLKSKGYDGFVDYNDRVTNGGHRMSRSASVFFEGSPVTVDKQSILIRRKNLKNMKVSELDNYLRTHNKAEIVGFTTSIVGSYGMIVANTYSDYVKKSIIKSELNSDRKNRNKTYRMLDSVSLTRGYGKYDSLNYAKRKEVRDYVDKYVDKYKKEHPDTKLSDYDIADMIVE